MLAITYFPAVLIIQAYLSLAGGVDAPGVGSAEKSTARCITTLKAARNYQLPGVAIVQPAAQASLALIDTTIVGEGIVPIVQSGGRFTTRIEPSFFDKSIYNFAPLGLA